MVLQVLRVHYDKRQQRLSRFQRVLDAKGQEVQPIKGKHIISSRKRKQHSDRVSSKLVKANVVDGQSNMETVVLVLDSDNQFTDKHHFVLTTYGDYDCHLQRYDTGDNLEGSEDPELNEEDMDARVFIHKSTLSGLKPARQKKFSWTEEADRQLVIEYARYRAALGAKFHRVDWASISNLPAPPDTCKRRMALLKTSTPFRKAVMKLCNMLAERYAKYLEKFLDKTLNYGDSEMMVRDYAFEEDSTWTSAPEPRKWDNFDANNIKVALDDVLRYKRMAKLEIVKDAFSDQDNVKDEFEDCDGSKASGQRSSSPQLPRKYEKLLSEGASVCRQMHESAAISNAAELFKLIFLSTSTAPEVPTLLAETLRRYSEHDLFAAFNYLREKKIMIGGSCNSPFILSQQFLHSISLSPFPSNTGKKAAKFANWLHEREKDLMEEGIDVPEDFQCGEVLNLCARVSSGELSITPCLPNEGVGEAEDNRTSKRKCDNGELYGGDASKKAKTSFAGEGEITSRREKGFPGIKLHLLRETIPRLHVIESFKDDVCASTLFGAQDQNIKFSTVDVDCVSSHSDVADHVREIFDSRRPIHQVFEVSESPWDAMASYAEYLMSSCSCQVKKLFLHPESFETLYSAIQKSGDQGLSMKEIPQVLNIQGTQLLWGLYGVFLVL